MLGMQSKRYVGKGVGGGSLFCKLRLYGFWLWFFFSVQLFFAVDAGCLGKLKL
jgi:hypothetical protein